MASAIKEYFIIACVFGGIGFGVYHFGKGFGKFQQQRADDWQADQDERALVIRRENEKAAEANRQNNLAAEKRIAAEKAGAVVVGKGVIPVNTRNGVGYQVINVTQGMVDARNKKAEEEKWKTSIDRDREKEEEDKKPERLRHKHNPADDWQAIPESVAQKLPTTTRPASH